MSLSVSEVSVVTINWNGIGHLRHLLPSLIPLRCREILMVDNGSSDGSQDFVRREYPQVRILQNDANQGFAAPSNWGAREASGSVVAFINNDMRAHPAWLEKALERLSRSTPCVASRILDWDGRRIDYNGSSLHYLGYALQKDIGRLIEEVSHEDKVLFPCGGAMLVDRSVFFELGGFDDDFFAVYEDVDFGWRLWIAGYEVALAPESLVYHRGHGTFSVHENEKLRYLMHRNALLTVFKNYEDENFRKILPLAIVLAIKRAILLSGVERESFYLWADSKDRIRNGDRQLGLQLIDALNHLVSLDDILESLPEILEKRKKVQALRRRSDSELTRLFREPLREIVANPVYVGQELRLLSLMDLGALFDLGQPGDGLQLLPDALEERVNRLRAELRSLQQIGVGKMQLAETRPEVSKFQRFWKIWRREGWKVACRRVREHLSRAN